MAPRYLHLIPKQTVKLFPKISFFTSATFFFFVTGTIRIDSRDFYYVNIVGDGRRRSRRIILL